MPHAGSQDLEHLLQCPMYVVVWNLKYLLVNWCLSTFKFLANLVVISYEWTACVLLLLLLLSAFDKTVTVCHECAGWALYCCCCSRLLTKAESNTTVHMRVMFVWLQLTLKAPATASQTPATTLVTSSPTETVSQPPSTAQVDLLGLGMTSCTITMFTLLSSWHSHCESSWSWYDDMHALCQHLQTQILLYYVITLNAVI